MTLCTSCGRRSSDPVTRGCTFVDQPLRPREPQRLVEPERWTPDSAEVNYARLKYAE